jgi:hypothetical protein
MEVPVAAVQPTVYTSDVLAGVLDWSHTPATVVWAVASAAPEVRWEEAAKFLGRIPAGGWAAEFQGVVEEAGRQRLVFRGQEEDALGRRVRLTLDLEIPGPAPQLGQMVLVTGRIAEICIDDPTEPAGMLMLDGATWR